MEMFLYVLMNEKLYIAGNVYKEKFLDIQSGKWMINTQKFLLDANRRFSSCNVFDIHELIMGIIKQRVGVI